MTVELDALLTLDDVLPLVPQYTSRKSALHALEAGRFPIRHVQGMSRWAFTVADVRALTQHGKITNPALIHRLVARGDTRTSRGMPPIEKRRHFFGSVARQKAKQAIA
jgi:hypothetical protein